MHIYHFNDFRKLSFLIQKQNQQPCPYRGYINRFIDFSDGISFIDLFARTIHCRENIKTNLQKLCWALE